MTGEERWLLLAASFYLLVVGGLTFCVGLYGEIVSWDQARSFMAWPFKPGGFFDLFTAAGAASLIAYGCSLVLIGAVVLAFSKLIGPNHNNSPADAG